MNIQFVLLAVSLLVISACTTLQTSPEPWESPLSVLEKSFDGEYKYWPKLPLLKSNYPDYTYRELYGYTPVHNLEEELIYQFVYMPSFSNGYVITIEIPSVVTAILKIEERGLNVHCDKSDDDCFTFRDVIRRAENPLAREDVEELFRVLNEIKFEKHPPGEYSVVSTDGTLWLIEEKKGERFRFWANKWPLSKDMIKLGNYFLNLTETMLITRPSN